MRAETGLFVARLVLCLVVAGLALPFTAAAEPLRVVTEEFPPYNYTDKGHVTGLATEVVEAVLKEIGVQATIQSMPWARAYDIARNGENVLIFSITRTAEREKMFKWIGPVAPSDWSLFALRGREVLLKQLADAKAYRTATVNEDAGEQYLVANGFVIGANLQSSNKYAFNYEKLRLGRVDLWVANDLVASHLVREAGDDPTKVLVRALPLPGLGDGGMYMAFGAKTPDDIVELFRKGLTAVKKNGTFELLQKKWL